MNEIIESNFNYVRKIELLLKEIDVDGDKKKEMLLAGFSRNLLSHFISINILIEKELYNSAFSLIRVFFENIVRLKYMYNIMDDAKIETIYNANSWNNHFPCMRTIVERLDEFYDVEFYSNIKERVYKVMCDYTHTGPIQIARNFNDIDDSISSNFSEELVIDTLRSSRELLKTTIIVFLELGYSKGFISREEMDDFLTL